MIVTSYVFKDGKISFENLNKLLAVVGKEHLVFGFKAQEKGRSLLYSYRPLAEVYGYESYKGKLTTAKRIL